MDLGLSEEQEMLRSAACDFLEQKCPKDTVKVIEESELGYSPELWREMAGLGWMGLVIPEKYGGSAMSFLDLAVLLEEMGRACLPGPFFTSVVASFSLLDAGDEEQKQRYLPRLASGESIFTMALAAGEAVYEGGAPGVRAVAGKDSYVLQGEALFVPYAHVADHIICLAGTAKGLTVFIVDAESPGLGVRLMGDIAGEKLCAVTCDKVEVIGKENILGRPDEGWSVVKKAMERAAAAQCCEMVGGMQQVLDMTVAYAGERQQFDRPIGSFQAVRHHCTDMAIYTDGARLTAYQAAWMLSQGLPCTREVAVAKAWGSEAYRRVIALSHQIHGGIGYTTDYDLQFYTRRSKCAQTAYGDARFHREVVARSMD